MRQDEGTESINYDIYNITLSLWYYIDQWLMDRHDHQEQVRQDEGNAINKFWCIQCNCKTLSLVNYICNMILLYWSVSNGYAWSTGVSVARWR